MSLLKVLFLSFCLCFDTSDAILRDMICVLQFFIWKSQINMLVHLNELIWHTLSILRSFNFCTHYVLPVFLTFVYNSSAIHCYAHDFL